MKLYLVLVLMCLIGCETPKIEQPAEALNDDERVVEKREYDWHSCMGLYDAGAPNGELWWWMMRNPSDSTDIPKELLAAIEAGDQNEVTSGRRRRFDETSTIPGVLNLGNYKLTDRVRAAISNNQHIKYLSIGGVLTEEDFQWLGTLHQLIGLQLVDADLANADLSKLAGLDGIRWLAICRPKNLRNDFENWPTFPNLETLSIRGGMIPDQIVSVFAQCKKLRSVHFYGTSIGDAGIKTLVADHPNLEFLVLYGTRITSNSVDYLIQLDRIAVLDVGQTPLSRDRENSGATLRQKLPRCEISFAS